MPDIYLAPLDSDEPMRKVGVGDFSFTPDGEEFSDEPILKKWPSFSRTIELTYPSGAWDFLQQTLATDRVRSSAVSLWNDAKQDQWVRHRERGLL